MKILFTGGGTGGHIFPIIAVVRELKRLTIKEVNPVRNFKGNAFDVSLESKISNGVNLFYIGPRDEISQKFLPKEGVKVKTIMTGKLRRYFGPKAIIQNIIDIFLKFPIGFFQSFSYIFFLAPDLIFSKGGYGSLPVTLAGSLLRTPIFLHESDIVPGLANRISAKFSSKIFVSFPAEEDKHFPVHPVRKGARLNSCQANVTGQGIELSNGVNKVISVGNANRRELLEGSKEMAKKIFNLTGEKPIILIFGGSQGAQRLNNLILQILPEILTEFELIHQAGTQNFKDVENSANTRLTNYVELKKYYHLFSFLEEEDLKQSYSACDLIISRAGSGSIFEISAAAKPSILIPLPKSAQNHQIKNAYAYAKNGACIVIEEVNITPPLFFLEKLKYLMSQSKELEKMQKAAREFSRPEAARVIAEYILGLTK